MSWVVLPVLNLMYGPLDQVIAVWGMKCVDYDFKFERHLARSLKTIKPSSSGSARKRKVAVGNVVGNGDNDVMSEDEDVEKGEGPDSDDSPSKRRRTAKGRAKQVMKYDWSDARIPGDSEDEDYKPT